MQMIVRVFIVLRTIVLISHFYRPQRQSLTVFLHANRQFSSELCLIHDSLGTASVAAKRLNTSFCRSVCLLVSGLAETILWTHF